MSRVFVITGTSRGIGLSLATHYLEQGGIVCGCSRKGSVINNNNYRHYELDVSNEELVLAMIRDVAHRYEQIHVLINNAGIASMNPVLLTPAKSVRNIFETNFLGSFLFCREVAKVMLRQKNGRIINLSSVARPLHLEGESIYAASKAAVENFTRILASELGNSGITVNALGPSPLPTDLLSGVGEDKIKNLLQLQAVSQLIEFDDVCNVTDFFISPASRYITGQIIYLGGVFG